MRAGQLATVRMLDRITHSDFCTSPNQSTSVTLTFSNLFPKPPVTPGLYPELELSRDTRVLISRHCPIPYLYLSNSGTK
jgi:hypothetical protein